MDFLGSWPASGVEEVPSCPVCGASERKLVYSGLVDDLFKVAPGQWNIFECIACESAWLDPRPSKKTLGLAYGSYYTHSEVDQPVVARKGVLGVFLHDSINDYLNVRFGLSRKPARRIGRFIVPLIPALAAAARAEFRHLPALPPGGGCLLDVGFGNGGFLKNACEMGWRAEGIDFDPQAVGVARARGLTVSDETVEDLVVRAARYDVITLSHVVEHVHDPVALLRSLRQLLNPGGVLWVETPNYQSFGRAYFGRYWRGLEPPRHLVLFSKKSLLLALSRSGFDVVSMPWHGVASSKVWYSSFVLSGKRPGVLRKAACIAMDFCAGLCSKRSEYLTVIARPS